MRIAVTAREPSLSSIVDERFGRAACFVVVDADTMAFEPLDNEQNVNAAQGAGIQAAALVADKNVDCVITGHCGPNAFRALAEAGIKVVVGAEGTVEETVQRFKKGELKPSESR